LRFRLKPWQFFALVAAGTIVLVFTIYRFRHRPELDSDTELVALLPRIDATVVYGDFRTLRKVGVLDVFAGSQTAQEQDYQEFVRQTRFDYTKDIDSMAAAIDQKQMFFIVRGRFDWSRLRQYAMSHGGACQGDVCHAPTSKPNRWASFLPIQSNVMGLVVSADKTAASAFSARSDRRSVPMPPQPLWVNVPQSALRNAAALSPALQLFAAPLAQADRALFSIGGSESAWFIRLEAQCDSAQKAQTLKGLMEARTSILKRALAREQAQPNPADLAALIAEGTFALEGAKMTGTWPLHRELLRSLQ
jgi:hypothetical protein